MCGVFGYVGATKASTKILNGLKRLEYRGYDSLGIAVIRERIHYYKKTGAIGDVKRINLPQDSSIGIGHTRWATHGKVSDTNAHPHMSSDYSFVVAQNGIVENFKQLKKYLQDKGYTFKSETDTEVIVRLIEDKLKKNNDLLEAVRQAFLDLEGRNTILVLDSKINQIIGIRNGSPMVIGIGKDNNEIFIASDVLSFIDQTNKIVECKDEELVQITKNNIFKYNIKTKRKLKYKVETVNFKHSKIDTDGHPHFMIKEIFEQQYTIKEAIQYPEEELNPLIDAIRESKNIYVIGAGTASYAAGQIAYFLRTYSGINAQEVKAYEYESYKSFFNNKTLIIAVSQSGETIDTIEVVEYAKKKGAKIASIVNMQGSTLTKLSDFSYLSRSGPEICVASTKAFTAQISWGLLVALTLKGNYTKAQKAIINVADKVKKFFNQRNLAQIQKLAKILIDKEHFFVLGKGQNFNIALEGALKVKEITYKHFEGFAAGELKHGVIALIEKNTPVFLIISKDVNTKDLISAASEVKARNAFVIALARNNHPVFDFWIKLPDLGIYDPLINIIPFQLLAYYMSVELGYNPDKPRNLAKSVTVK